MRSFVSAVFFTLMTLTAYSYADDAIDLFEVRLLQLDEAEQALSATDIDRQLQQAMRIELVRLTGDPGFLSRPGAQGFLQSPKRWLKHYRFEPYRVDGVVVGRWLVFEFDPNRFYETFQKQGLVIWPLANRPTTLVMGSQRVAGTLIKLTSETLGNLPRLDFRPEAAQLALPVETPDLAAAWVYPDSTGVNARVADLLQTSDARFLLSFQVVATIQGGERYRWQLFDRSGTLALTGQARSTELRQDFYQTFADLIRFYSARYREQATFLGTLTLKVSRLTSADALIELEAALNAMKPVVHQVRLMSVQQKMAEFEVVYQGRYEDLLAKIHALPGLVNIQDDAVIGWVQAVYEAPDNVVDGAVDDPVESAMPPPEPGVEPETIPIEPAQPIAPASVMNE